MKYKHQVRTTQVYQDKEIEAKIDIFDEEVETIKATVTGYKPPKEKTVGRERNVLETFSSRLMSKTTGNFAIGFSRERLIHAPILDTCQQCRE